MDKQKLMDAFTDLYDELKVFAATLERNESDVQDLLQDLAEILLVKGDTLGEVRVPIAYFKTCLRHIKYNKLRKSARETCVDPNDLDAFQPQKDDDMTGTEILGWLKEQLEACSPEFREAFIKYHIDGHPLEHVAQGLNMTPNAVSQRFSRMRRKLKREASALYMAFILLILKTR